MSSDPAARRVLRTTFDRDAEAYDRTRPVLPDALFDDLTRVAGLGPGDRVLEIGCGTGQATVPLARRGLAVTAIELGAALADRTRANLAGFPAVTVVTSSFEGWSAPARGSNFAAVIAVSSLHWIDPDVRYASPPRSSGRG